MHCSSEMAEKWRQDNITTLKEKTRKEKMKLLTAEREKEEEARQQLESAAQAFKSWLVHYTLYCNCKHQKFVDEYFHKLPGQSTKF